MARSFIKSYATPAARGTAQRNHAWLTSYAAPMVLPRILSTGPTELEFEWAVGRHAEPRDLPLLADHLGAAHGAAWLRCLRGARLTAPHTDSQGVLIPGFTAPREAALHQRYRDGYLTARELPSALARLKEAAARPAAFYKDTNPRNVLITPSGRPVTLDPDDLTLAPFGYDLAKLVVTLAMTYGRLADDQVTRALAAYNRAAAAHHPALGDTTPAQFLAYAELHGVLTAPYLGRGGYRWSWSQVRPGPLPDAALSHPAHRRKPCP
ncbi:phosphotransferase [Streptomyces sp. B1866]|uniref:phosphotransferase n=1 Tax=Streptomyces sp. B1866 TaxID=3075431 RepID=UPI00288E7121|nr:phosphotransferase [Streptomyces sp. B1866]MDT3397626.1 phosphotransferase [Streptomyces sp. B1866]